MGSRPWPTVPCLWLSSSWLNHWVKTLSDQLLVKVTIKMANQWSRWEVVMWTLLWMLAQALEADCIGSSPITTAYSLSDVR